VQPASISCGCGAQVVRRRGLTPAGISSEVAYGSLRLEYMQALGAHSRATVGRGRDGSDKTTAGSRAHAGSRHRHSARDRTRDLFHPMAAERLLPRAASRSSAHYLVLRRKVRSKAGWFQSPDFDPSIVGYGGMWRMYDERTSPRSAFVTIFNIAATARSCSRAWSSGLRHGREVGDLGVRTSNENAMKMYETFASRSLAGARVTTRTTARTRS